MTDFRLHRPHEFTSHGRVVEQVANFDRRPNRPTPRFDHTDLSAVDFELRPGLTNAKLFARDRNVCAYCGGHFHETELTREHIIPFAQNGRDIWMNVVTACRACNHRKSSRTPEQAHMPLLYAPYVPSLWEDFILRNRRILADQMEFLMAHLPKSSRLHG